MSARHYYIEETSDGGFAVQTVEGWREDFSSYHRTREEAEAAMAAEIARDAAPDLYAACKGLVDVFDYLDAVVKGGFIPILLGIDWRERVAAGKAAIAKAKGGAP